MHLIWVWRVVVGFFFFPEINMIDRIQGISLSWFHLLSHEFGGKRGSTVDAFQDFYFSAV